MFALYFFRKFSSLISLQESNLFVAVYKVGANDIFWCLAWFMNMFLSLILRRKKLSWS